MTYSPFSLVGRRVLVTGASSGIGRACAKSVSQLGAEVIITGRNENRLEETKEQIGLNAVPLVADLTNDSDVDRLVAEIPVVDGVIHAAGVVVRNTIKFSTRAQLNQVFETNVIAPIVLTQKLLKSRKLNSKSSLIFISSIAALAGVKGMPAYSGTKGAILSIVRSLALELSPNHIRVNAISPGHVRTPMTEDLDAAELEESVRQYEKQYPLGFGEPVDVANTAAFLLSPASRWMTGTNLVLDGGFTCQ